MSEAEFQEALQKGIRAARRGAKEPARRLLTHAVQADPNSEEAWLWLSRVIDAPERRADCLQRVLAINPDNRWAAEQLTALQTELTALPAEEAEMPVPVAPVQQVPREPTPELELDLLQCPNCGRALKLQSGAKAKTLVCHFCSSVLDLTVEQAAVIGQGRRGRPYVPIEPGMEGTFDGERYQVIGWIRYEGWDDEDRWRWDEWLLVSSIGEFRWLSYDPEEGFLFQKQITPSKAFNPDIATHIPVAGTSARVTERSPARVIAFAGELTWRARVGDTLRYLEAKHGDTRYSVEYTRDEIELLGGRTLSGIEVWQAFGRQDLVEKAVQRTKRKKQYRTLAIACAVFAVLGCIGALFASLMTGSKLLAKDLKLTTGEQTVGPFEITQPGKVHRISLKSGPLPTNSWAVVDVSMEDSKENEFYLFAAEFWDEEGRDSEGYWHENDLKEGFLFRPDDAGQYTLSLAIDEATVQSIDLEVTVKGGIWLSRYFIIFVVACVVLGFLFSVLAAAMTGEPS